MEENNNSQEIDLSKITLTEKDVKSAGLDHRFVGQPASVLLEQHLTARGLATRASQEKAELAKELEVAKNAKKEPVKSLDPLQYTEAQMEEYQAVLAAEIRRIAREEVSQTVAPIQNSYKKDQEAKVMKAINDGVPEDVNGLDAVKAWAIDNGVTEKDLPTYMSNPKVLINSVINHANMAHIKANQNKTDHLTGLKLTQEAKKVVQNKTASSINSSQRTQSKDSTSASRIADRLERTAALKNQQ